jgi:hypothetical protein
MLYRKEDDIMKSLRCKNIIDGFETVNEFFKNKIVKEVYPDWANKIDEVKTFIKTISINQDTIQKYRTVIEKHVKTVLGKCTKDEIDIRKQLDYIIGVSAKNDKVIQYLEIPDTYYTVIDKETDNVMFKEIYDKLIVF